MPRIMAIDYGTKRVGIAVTDNLKIIATALDTVHPIHLMKFFEDYFSKEVVDTLVVGEPQKLGGGDTDATKPINDFIAHFKKKYPTIKIEREDERITSKMAMNALISAGSKKKDRQNKGNIDKISAVIILQSYLERHV